MYSDISTSENQLKAKRKYQKYLHTQLNTAIRLYHQLGDKHRALALEAVNKLNRIRRQLYEKALELGYVAKCKDSIIVCKGECCKWHFPKNLNCRDLFVMVCSVSADKQSILADQMTFNNEKYQCPLLLENGCLLPFDSRPLVCSNAYPCFSKDLYHKFLEKQKKRIDVQYRFLDNLLK